MGSAASNTSRLGGGSWHRLLLTLASNRGCDGYGLSDDGDERQVGNVGDVPFRQCSSILPTVVMAVTPYRKSTYLSRFLLFAHEHSRQLRCTALHSRTSAAGKITAG